MWPNKSLNYLTFNFNLRFTSEIEDYKKFHFEKFVWLSKCHKKNFSTFSIKVFAFIYVSSYSRMMFTSHYKDKSGFRLEFEEKCDAQLKEFFMSQYELVDDVAKDKLHCTCCNIHIGTAPSKQNLIRTHQVLGTTQCLQCFTFYVSWKFFCLFTFDKI